MSEEIRMDRDELLDLRAELVALQELHDPYFTLRPDAVQVRADPYRVPRIDVLEAATTRGVCGGTVPVTDDGVVYFARAVGTDFVKIGHTTQDPEARLASLRTGSPHALVLEHVAPGSASDERALHAQLAARRLHLEWFRLTSDEVHGVVANHQGGGTTAVCACGRVHYYGERPACWTCDPDDGDPWA